MAGLEQKAPGRRMKKAVLQCRPSDLESLPSSRVLFRRVVSRE